MVQLYLEDKMGRKCEHKVSQQISRVCNSKACCIHTMYCNVIAMSVMGEGSVLMVDVYTIVNLVVRVHGVPTGYLKRYVRIVMEGDFVSMGRQSTFARFVVEVHCARPRCVR